MEALIEPNARKTPYGKETRAAHGGFIGTRSNKPGKLRVSAANQLLL